MAEGSAAVNEEANEQEQEVLFEFEGYPIEKQFVKLSGVSALELDEVLDHGLEVTLEIRGVVQDTDITTRARGRKDTTAKITRVTRTIKVDSAKVKRTVPQLIKD